MKNVTRTLLMTVVTFVLLLMTSNTFAQDLTGRWEGTLLWPGNGGVKDDMVYDWEAEKWIGINKAPTKLALVLEKADEDGKYKGEYLYGASGYDKMFFEAVFVDLLLKGASGAGIRGGRQWGGYMELNFREQDGKRYLEGSWRTYEKTNVWEGRVALRYEDGN